jgi:methionine synthase II (cobalamin-independent)
MQTGREETKVVRAYLEALEAHKPKRGRKRDPERIQQRVAAIDEMLATSDPLTRVHLMQERTDLSDELDKLGQTVDITELENAFVDVVASYSQRRGVSAETWQAAGVPVAVLRRGGVR